MEVLTHFYKGYDTTNWIKMADKLFIVLRKLLFS